MANSSKFRADHIGSFLRPQPLLEARRRFKAGMIDEDELREVEDEQIAKVVRMQKDSAIDIITDGEFRRQDFRTGFVQAFSGIEQRMVDLPWKGPGGTVMLPSAHFEVTERLQQQRRLAEGEVAYLQSLTSAPLKVTLIAPGFLVDRFWNDETTGRVYESREEFAADVVAATRAEIEALFADGVRYVQLDNPGYGAYMDASKRERMQSLGQDPYQGFRRVLDADRAAVEGIEIPRRCSLGLHVCRGNQASLWLNEGSYDAIAEELFSTLPVNRFLVEYDDDRAGGFDALRFVPAGTMVVLGLVSTKTPELETIEDLQFRIDEAARIVDWDDLALSPQCGFASVAEGGNTLTADDQFRKLQLVSDTALATWGIEL
jgi:5-methyltetrahydropteroyltriglutamate--homocysteine methyltransferase